MAKKRATNSHKTKQLTRAEKRFNKTADELFGTHARSKLGKLRTEYVIEYNKLKDRVKSWKKKHGIEFKDIPSHSGRIKPSDIQAIKNITFKNISKNLPTNKPQYEYKPPTESDYINRDSYDTHDQTDDSLSAYREYYYSQESDYSLSETIHDRDAEMREWIDEKIEQLSTIDLVTTSADTYYERSEKLRTILRDTENIMGTEEFYDFLQDPDTVDALNESATDYLNESEGQRGERDAEHDLNTFMTILNGNKPLSEEQVYRFIETGRFTSGLF